MDVLANLGLSTENCIAKVVKEVEEQFIKTTYNQHKEILMKKKREQEAEMQQAQNDLLQQMRENRHNVRDQYLIAFALKFSHRNLEKFRYMPRN